VKLTPSEPTEADCTLSSIIRQEFVVDQPRKRVGIGEGGCGEELGKQLHVVGLALDGVGEHYVRSRNGLVRPWRDDGGGLHLVDRRLLDSEHYVSGFEGLVGMCTGFDIVRSAECSPFAVLNEHIHAGGVDEMVDGIRSQRSTAFPNPRWVFFPNANDEPGSIHGGRVTSSEDYWGTFEQRHWGVSGWWWSHAQDPREAKGDTRPTTKYAASENPDSGYHEDQSRWRRVIIAAS
jgi:hypothetical protein